MEENTNFVTFTKETKNGSTFLVSKSFCLSDIYSDADFIPLYITWDIVADKDNPVPDLYFQIYTVNSEDIPVSERIGNKYITENNLSSDTYYFLQALDVPSIDVTSLKVYIGVVNQISGNDYRKHLIQRDYQRKVQYNPSVLCVPSEEEYNKEKDNADFGRIENTALNEKILNPAGGTAWDICSYDFLNGLTPCNCTTIHPNLLRQEQMNNINGLFMVCNDGGVKPENQKEIESNEGCIYQIRSYDLATMTFVKSQNGWIVIDPLGGIENVRKGLEQFRSKFSNEEGNNSIKAVIVTHSHVDHYRGIMGLVENGKCAEEAFYSPGGPYINAPEELAIVSDEPKKYETITTGEDQIMYIAPVGFYDEAISENLYLGNSMTRRSAYMYGRTLPHDERGHVGSGLGKTVGDATGTLIKPSLEISFPDKDVRTFLIDGLTVSFLDAHDSEAPSEYHIYFEKYKTLCPGENVTHTMHNLLTSRGAKIRNPKAFAQAIKRSLEEWGSHLEVIIGTHHWPTWGKDECVDMMEKQRDMYLYFNNQVIHCINKGMNMEEIAEHFQLPESLGQKCYNRGYYGSLNHNTKAVFQYYVGWWDGNPANYFKYPESEAAKRFVHCMGGCDKVLKKAQDYFDAGDYRWTIELTKQVLFYPDNDQAIEIDIDYYTAARLLQADAMEQLGYGFESGTWRNIFLTGAKDLRENNHQPSNMNSRIDKSAAQIASLEPEQAFEYMSILVDGTAVDIESARLEWNVGFTTDGLYYRLFLENCVLHHEKLKEEPKSENKYTKYADMGAFAEDYKKAILSKEAHSNELNQLCDYLELPDENWNIVFPLDKKGG
ncbi:alkyl/aryl-sulfatase [Phocaeicola sp.]